MSWAVYCDSDLVYDPRLQEYLVPQLHLTQELNKADVLNFVIYPQHPSFDIFKRLKSTITVKENGVIKSRCRLIDDVIGWNNERECLCEGELAFFNDSVQRPFTFPQDATNTTPADYFKFLVNRHNEQVSEDRQFTVGNVTVTDPNGYISRSDTEYSTTWQLLNEGLLQTHGGYLWVRHVGTKNYIDYLSDFNVLANQPITAGINLLGISTERNGADIATAILPLGATDEETDERVTISSLADSTTSDICKSGDIVYSIAAENLYGSRITKVVTFDAVTTPANLLTSATAELAIDRLLPSTVTITAADLSAAGYDYNAFTLGTYVTINDPWHEKEHSLSATYLVQKVDIDLLNPGNSKLTLGATELSLTESNRRSLQTAMRVVETNVTKETAKAVREVERRNMSALEQSDQEIRATVSENYYTKGETNDLVSSVSSQISQTASGWNLTFNTLVQDFNDVQSNTNAQFEALQQYIRLEGGTITLGEVGNPITLTIENDQIGIYRNGVAVTYWTGDQFLLPNGVTIPVGGTLTLGSFAFIPRSNGSLDFTWVGD